MQEFQPISLVAGAAVGTRLGDATLEFVDRKEVKWASHWIRRPLRVVRSSG